MLNKTISSKNIPWVYNRTAFCDFVEFLHVEKKKKEIARKTT